MSDDAYFKPPAPVIEGQIDVLAMLEDCARHGADGRTTDLDRPSTPDNEPDASLSATSEAVPAVNPPSLNAEARTHESEDDEQTPADVERPAISDGPNGASPEEACEEARTVDVHASAVLEDVPPGAGAEDADACIGSLLTGPAPASIAERLEAAIASGWTAKALAAELNVSTSAVTSWRGGDVPTQANQRAVLALLNERPLPTDLLADKLPPTISAGDSTPARTRRAPDPKLGTNGWKTARAEHHRWLREQEQEGVLASDAVRILPLAPPKEPPGAIDVHADYLRAKQGAPTPFRAVDPAWQLLGQVPPAPCSGELADSYWRATLISRIDLSAVRQKAGRQMSGKAGLLFQTGLGGTVLDRLPSLDSLDYEAIAFFDRVGLSTKELLARYAFPTLERKAVEYRLRKYLKHGLVEFVRPPLKDVFDEGPAPRLYRLTQRCWELIAQPYELTLRSKYQPRKRISTDSLGRIGHHHRSASYVVEFLSRVPGALPSWLTPGSGYGHIDPPKIPADGQFGRRTVRPPDARDLTKTHPRSGAPWPYYDWPEVIVGTIEPDEILHLEAELVSQKVMLELCFEFDNGRHFRKNLLKLHAYDQYLLGWHELRPGRLSEHRPAVLFVFRSAEDMLSTMRVADQGVPPLAGQDPGAHKPLSGRIGDTSHSPEWSYYPGRELTFFALEQDIYRGSARVLRLPTYPPDVRRMIGETADFFVHTMDLLRLLSTRSTTQGRLNDSSLRAAFGLTDE